MTLGPDRGRACCGLMVPVFVYAEVKVPLPFERAKEAIDNALADRGLVAESRKAEGDGGTFRMPVGPLGSRGPAKEVLVRLLPGHAVTGRYVVPLRWEVSGPAGPLFPALEGELVLAPDGARSTLLSMGGNYNPPLGAVGAKIDHAMMYKIAFLTINDLVREVADRVHHHAALAERPVG